MAVEVGSDPLVWKVFAGFFGVVATIFGYFIRKRDEKIEENTHEVLSLTKEMVVLKTHVEMFSLEQAEMKESLRGMVDCVQEIRIRLAGLPCNTCNKNRDRD